MTATLLITKVKKLSGSKPLGVYFEAGDSRKHYKPSHVPPTYTVECEVDEGALVKLTFQDRKVLIKVLRVMRPDLTPDINNLEAELELAGG